MRKKITALVVAAAIALGTMATPKRAEAACWGCWAGAGIVAGLIGGAIIASWAYGYGPYYGYGYPGYDGWGYGYPYGYAHAYYGGYYAPRAYWGPHYYAHHYYYGHRHYARHYYRHRYYW